MINLPPPDINSSYYGLQYTLGHGSGCDFSPGCFLDFKLFISKPATKALPHWHQPCRFQYVTMRLADSLPQCKLKELAMLKMDLENGKDIRMDTAYTINRNLIDKIDGWLDAGNGACLFNDPGARLIVQKALLYYDNVKYALYDYVIMPNHIHFIIIPGVNMTLKDILVPFKKYTAREVNKLFGKNGPLWQTDFYDYMPRNLSDLNDRIRYIIQNPTGLR